MDADRLSCDEPGCRDAATEGPDGAWCFVHAPDVDSSSEEYVRPAEQDGEYLHPAHQLIAETLASGGPVEDELDAATAVLDALAAAGWHLLTAEDAEKVLGAYVLQEIRAGRVTTHNTEVQA